MVDPDIVSAVLCNQCKVARGADRGVLIDAGSKVLNGTCEQIISSGTDSAAVHVHL